MASTTIYPQGNAEFIVPATQSVAISNYGGGIAKIYYLIENVNRPDAYQFQQTLNNSAVTLGAFSTATTVKIEANNSKVIYDVGSSPDTGIGDADTLNGLPSDTTDTADTIAARDSSGDIAANAFESTVTTGTAPLTVASTTKVDNLNADLLDGFNSASTSIASTVVTRDPSADVTANAFISDVATGTAPLTVSSTTAVANLNADQTDGYDADETDTGSTLAARDASGDLQANAFESTVATGTAPLTVASTTKVTNLNAELLDGYNTSVSGANDSVVVRSATGDIQVSHTSAIQSFDSGTTLRDILQIVAQDSVYCGSASLLITLLSNGPIVHSQGSTTAKTTSTTLTAAEIRTAIITVDNGAAGTTTLTLPTAANMDAEFTDIPGSNRIFEFSVINISTVAAEDADVATNTGWTLVGNMDIESAATSNDRSAARFGARRTGAGAWTLYRLS